MSHSDIDILKLVTLKLVGLDDLINGDGDTQVGKNFFDKVHLNSKFRYHSNTFHLQNQIFLDIWKHKIFPGKFLSS